MSQLNILILLVAANVFYYLLVAANLFYLITPAPDLNPDFTIPRQVVTLAFEKDKDYDPGKEITDDPHGPGVKGKDPHGPDPVDEIHDKNLPANNPDKYLEDAD